MTDWPFGELKEGHHSVVVADPPWRFTDQGTRLSPAYEGHQRKSGSHYSHMSLNDIMELPVRRLVNPEGGWLALWVPWSMLEEGLCVMSAWGFSFVTAGVWVKTTKIYDLVRDAVESLQKALDSAAPDRRLVLRALARLVKFLSKSLVRIGGGHHLRMASEPLLLGRCGSEWSRAQVKNIPNVWMAPRQSHSAKPDQVQLDLQRLWPGPYAELFARRQLNPEWNCWGDEV